MHATNRAFESRHPLHSLSPGELRGKSVPGLPSKNMAGETRPRLRTSQACALEEISAPFGKIQNPECRALCREDAETGQAAERASHSYASYRLAHLFAAELRVADDRGRGCTVDPG